MIKKIAFLSALVIFSAAAHGQKIQKWKMDAVVKSFSKNNDTVYVVNFWATFCKPCIAEIPDFIRIVKKYEKQKVKLLLVSLDLPTFYPAKIAAFAKKNNYTVPLAWLNETNADHFCPMIDKTWSGSIPSTIVVNNKTGYRKFTEGEMGAAEFEAMIKEAVGGTAFHKFVAPMNNAELVEPGPSSLTSFKPVTFKSADSAVYAVSDGTVSSIARIEGTRIAIIKDENSLFYTYSNLGTVTVKKGELVKKGQLIGYGSHGLDKNRSEIDFYLNSVYDNVPLTKNNFTARNGR